MTKPSKIYSQCHNDLENQGYTLLSIDLEEEILQAVKEKDFKQLDELIKKETLNTGYIFKTLSEFCSLSEIEFIISLRESTNEWEEDGIWHDDGSRILAFSLSLTLGEVEGGLLEFRKKGELEKSSIPTPSYADMIIFKTGFDHYEHRIKQVTKGSRLIIAGWCYP